VFCDDKALVIQTRIPSPRFHKLLNGVFFFKILFYT